jgi:hypothetical protein
MARRGVGEEQRRAAALQAGRKMVSRGERPLYRLRHVDGRWTVDAMSWLTVAASSRSEAMEAARSAIAESLEVSPGAFDID